MAFVILALIVGVPAAEIYVLIEVGSLIGGLATVAAIIFTAIIGTALFRVQGIATLARVQQELNEGRMPLGEVLSGLGLLFAGLMLLIPGFVTDAIGLILFVPFLRRVVMKGLVAWLIARGMDPNSGVRFSVNAGGFQPGSGASSGPVIDGEFDDLGDKPDPERPKIEDQETRT